MTRRAPTPRPGGRRRHRHLRARALRVVPTSAWRFRLDPATIGTGSRHPARMRAMTLPEILDGKATAAAIKSDLTARVAALKEQGVTPGLGTILVGDDPGSQKYVAGKHRDCAEVGIASIQRELPGDGHPGGDRGGRPRAERRPGLHRLHRPAAPAQGHRREPRPGADGPGQGRRRPAPDEPRPAGAERAGAAALHARTASSSCCAATACELNGRRGRASSAAASPSAARCALLLTRAVGERHRDPVPHRHPRPGRAPAAGPTSSSPPPASPHLIRPEDVKPGAAVLDVGVSRDADGKIVGDVHPDVAEVAGFDLPEPGWRRPDDPRPAAGQRGRGGGGAVPAEHARRTVEL